MSNRCRKYYINAIARIFIPGLLFCSLAACRNDPGEIRMLTGSGNPQEDRAEDVTIMYSKGGKINVRLFAHSFARNENAKPPYLDMNNGLKAEFFNDSEQVDNVLTADSSRYYEAQGNILVWGHVLIKSAKGEQLETEELVWNQSIEKFFTEKPVKITTPNEVLDGIGMEANRDFTWYKILKPRGSVSVEKGEVPQ